MLRGMSRLLSLGLLGSAVVVALACSSTGDGGDDGLYAGSGGGSAASAGGGGRSGGGGNGGGNGGTGAAINIGGSSGSVTDPDAGCATSSGKADIVPPTLMLVVDTSGSMGDPPPGGGGSKLALTKTALVTALGGMPDTNHVGLYNFPNTAPLGANCTNPNLRVPVAPLDQQQRTRLTNQINSLSALGGTPTQEAFRVGADGVANYSAPGQRFVVLLTDGDPTYGPNCVGTGSQKIPPAQQDALVNAVQARRASGIRTFVIGSPGSENSRDVLSRMARAGGTDTPGCSDTGPNYCHFDMTTAQNFGQALNQALQAISGQALTCSFAIPTPSDGQEIDLGRVNVVYTPSGQPAEEIGKSSNNCQSGWTYSSDNSRIELCGADCDRVKADPGGRVDVVFGCTTKIQ